jgi:hypothetical protein
MFFEVQGGGGQHPDPACGMLAVAGAFRVHCPWISPSQLFRNVDNRHSPHPRALPSSSVRAAPEKTGVINDHLAESVNTHFRKSFMISQNYGK